MFSGRIEVTRAPFFPWYNGVLRTSILPDWGVVFVSWGLDLCTGSGLFALFMSKYLNNIIASDIDENAINISLFNVSLNGLQSKIEIRNQNIKETVESSEKYDVITCNPPFIPVPKELNLPVYARGISNDGLGYYRLIIKNIEHMLTDNGICYLVGEFAGDNLQPFFWDRINRICKKV